MVGFGFHLGFPTGRPGAGSPNVLLGGTIDASPTFEAALQLEHDLSGEIEIVKDYPAFRAALNPTHLLFGSIAPTPAFSADLHTAISLEGSIDVDPTFAAEMENPVFVSMAGSIDVDPEFTADMEEPVDPADTLIDAFAVAPSANREAAIRAAIGSMITEGIWDKIDALYVYHATTEQQALLNWKNPSVSATKVGTPTFTSNTHFSTTNGLANYLRAPWSPVNYAADKASFGAYVFNVPTTNMKLCGVESPTGAFAQLQVRNGSSGSLYVNDADGSNPTSIPSSATSTGYFGARNTGSNAQDYRRGSTTFAGANDNAAGVLPVATWFQTFGSGSGSTISCSYVYYGGLTMAETGDLFDILQTYRAAPA